MYRSLFTSPRLLEAAQSAFVWQEHMSKVILTALLSMVPMYEGRYAVLTGVAMGMPTLFTYLLAFVASSIPVPIILLLLRPVLDWFYTLPIAPVRKFAAWLERALRASARRCAPPVNPARWAGWPPRLLRHAGTDRTVRVCRAAPAGTGIWTGSAIATLFEMPRLKSAAAILLGNATACLITTLAATGVIHFLG